ncbi:MAG: hypothetical protein EAZ30_15930 [Betaproteobacteria bacterium]|nr:MAG: hypothetical protein EAZ30_15930 [Betaproteobacteria bacterium]
MRAMWKRMGVATVGMLTLLLATASSAADDKKFGQTRIALYDIPATTIAKFQAFKPSAPMKGESVIVSTLLADSESWAGPEFVASATANPHTIVVTVRGTATADGDASTLWNVGWVLEDGVRRLNVLPGIAKVGAKAGERVEVTGASPTSFKESRKVGVALELVDAKNIRFEGVRVEVWSGVPEPSKLELSYAFRYAIIGLVLGLVFWWWRRN